MFMIAISIYIYIYICTMCYMIHHPMYKRYHIHIHIYTLEHFGGFSWYHRNLEHLGYKCCRCSLRPLGSKWSTHTTPLETPELNRVCRLCAILQLESALQRHGKVDPHAGEEGVGGQPEVPRRAGGGGLSVLLLYFSYIYIYIFQGEGTKIKPPRKEQGIYHLAISTKHTHTHKHTHQKLYILKSCAGGSILDKSCSRPSPNAPMACEIMPASSSPQVGLVSWGCNNSENKGANVCCCNT